VPYPLRPLLLSVRLQLRSWWSAQRLRQRFPHLTLHPPVVWTYDELDAIHVGPHVKISAFCEIAVVARSPLSSIPGSLSIGSHTVIGSFANLRAAGGSISIGPDCLIAQHVSLIASNHQLRAGQTYWRLPWDEQKTGVTLGQNVWLGCGVTVLPGVSIGDHAVVGANSVVTKSIPAGTVWAGNPARQLRTIS
jgi:acetyltransferase-like isoleucine patch superfamily enzyme